MAKQKRYTKEIGTYDGISDVNEFESNLLPTPQNGIKILEPGFEPIWQYDKHLNPLLIQARTDFKREITTTIDSGDLLKINNGLKDYVKSSSTPTNNLNLLKMSILNTFGNDILTSLYSICDDSTKQIIPPSYFENINKLNSTDDLLISSKSIKKYKELAQKYTYDVLVEYIDNCESLLEDDIEDLIVFRGQGNHRYYNNNIKSHADTLSIFTGVGSHSISYFERQIFNSYTINERVAQTFMVNNKNQRRVILSAYFETIKENIFSSFIVSDLFIDGQYELLCIPNQNNLYISEEVNDAQSAEFFLCSDENCSKPLFRDSI